MPEESWESKISYARRPDDGTLHIVISGAWDMTHGLPPTETFHDSLQNDPPVRLVAFDTDQVTRWDTSLLIFVKAIIDHCALAGIDVRTDGLPQGAQRLLNLATAVPEREDIRKEDKDDPFLARIGEDVLLVEKSLSETLAFIGEAFLAFLRFLAGKARFRRSDLSLLLQDCGARALPIVSLISLLVGLILAFVGAIQLRLFGAQIYVADLVGLGMAREMGAMMTAVIMAGRTGAAFAAQLGTMQVNEEIDAFKTLGISPMEYLVLPRMIALVFMLPLLCLYANLMGMIGGALVGISMLDLSLAEYYHETRNAVRLIDFVAGLIKSGVFGVLVALAGCYRGVRCGRSASAVGEAATSAVVTAIVLIVVSDALLTVIYDILGI